MKYSLCGLCLVVILVVAGVRGLPAQDPSPDPNAPASTTPTEKSPEERVTENVNDAADAAQKKVKEIAKEVDQSPRAKEISAGILQPIYQLAEQLSFPLFHWAAFAILAAGVVSYALQLVLGKLVVLARMGFSPAEIIADAHGLVISLVGLVLTTQAAAENSTFTRSPFAVISAAAVGLVAGIILYRWGQAQEVQAAIARGITPVKK